MLCVVCCVQGKVYSGKESLPEVLELASETASNVSLVVTVVRYTQSPPQ